MPEVSSTQELVSQIHAAPGQIVLAVTGGGSRAIADLLEVPGGSRTLLEAVVPYSAAALAEFFGAAPSSLVPLAPLGRWQWRRFSAAGAI